MCPCRAPAHGGRRRHDVRVTVLAAGLALLAAGLFAVSTVAQQRSAATVPDERARGLGLIRVLVRRPRWWAGVIGDGGGYLVQAAALGFGSLLLVQPLLVTTLLFALPLGAAWAGRTLTRTDWVWAALLAVSLAVFVVSGNPTDGVDRAPVRDWLPAGAVLAGLFLVCVVAAARRRGVTRAASRGRSRWRPARRSRPRERGGRGQPLSARSRSCPNRRRRSCRRWQRTRARVRAGGSAAW